MASTTEIRTAIDNADSIEGFVAADAMLRQMEKDADQKEQYQTLLGELNAKSAPAMMVFKSEVEQAGDLPRFMRDAAILREAGYPTGEAVRGWITRILREGVTDVQAITAEAMDDDTLSDADRKAVIRLINAARGGRGGMRMEANWTDVGYSPVAQAALVRAEMKVEEIADYDGDDLYDFLRVRIQDADRAAALDILGSEVHNVTGEGASLLRTAIRLRSASLAGMTLAAIVDRFGWHTVQAIYAGRDVTRSLTDADLIAEFTDLMDQVQAPVDAIRAVDEKLGQRVIGETWNRSGERLSDRKKLAEAQKRIEERLADL